MKRQQPVFRFAPSPNGELHLGHALSALTGYELAQQFGGRFLVRLEDIDIGRTRPEYIRGIFDDLAWLGITWEEPVLRQSEHFDVYREAADKLLRMGVLYRCFATRTELVKAQSASGKVDPDGAPLVSRAHSENRAEEIEQRHRGGESFALRLDMSRAMEAVHQKLGSRPLTFTAFDATGVKRSIAAQPERWGDAIIVRKDVPTSYHLSVVIDDARQGITHVTRGEDLLASTDLHRLLQVLLDLPQPLYHHHPLLKDALGRKLSKSARDTSLRSLRQNGMTAAELRVAIGL